MSWFGAARRGSFRPLRRRHARATAVASAKLVTRARPAGGILLLAGALVAGALLAGCGTPAATPTSPPQSGGTSTPSATSTPSGTPSTTTPTSPGERAPADFVALSDVDPTIIQDIRYNTAHNFVGRPIKGYTEPLCILTRQAAERLHRVQTAARARGYSVKVYDCYRPRRAGEDFVAWARRLDDQRMKAEFYPRVDKSALFDQGYVGGGLTSHSRGSTVDLTLVANPPRSQRPYQPGEPLVSCLAPQAQRFPDNSVDMGTGFDCFDSLAHTLDPRITGAARANRLLLKQLMTDAGFTNYANEWWHYTLNGAPYPDTYFDFPVQRAALRR